MRDRSRTVVIILFVLLIFVMASLQLSKLQRCDTMTGYVMINAHSTNTTRKMIANNQYWRWAMPVIQYIFVDEYEIEVWEKVGAWWQSIKRFKITRSDYERFQPSAERKVKIRYNENDEASTLISIEFER